MRVAAILFFVFGCWGHVWAETCGDADGSGIVTVTDGVNTLRAAADLSSSCSIAVCDVDGNGIITVTDGVNVLRLAAGLDAPTDCDAALPTPTPLRTSTPQPTFTAGGGCCKHCSTGKPCGDSCVSVIFTCHQPPGCACF